MRNITLKKSNKQKQKVKKTCKTKIMVTRTHWLCLSKRCTCAVGELASRPAAFVTESSTSTVKQSRLQSLCLLFKTRKPHTKWGQVNVIGLCARISTLESYADLHKQIK